MTKHDLITKLAMIEKFCQGVAIGGYEANQGMADAFTTIANNLGKLMDMLIAEMGEEI